MVKISQIIPSEIRTTIPFYFREDGFEVWDNILVYSPTLERIDYFHKRLQQVKNEDIDILILLIECFTDVENDLDIKKIEDFAIYFSGTWDALQAEMYQIYSEVIKQGLQAREKITSINTQTLDVLKQIAPEDYEKIKKAQQIISETDEQLR